MVRTDGGELNTIDPSTVDDQAERVVVSFRAPDTDPDENDSWWVADSEWLSERLRDGTYRRYLRWAHAGPVTVGDEWEEFVNCGCEHPQDVLLRVERIENGTAIGAATTIEIVSRYTFVQD
jgi:hypothetical protein